MCIQEVAELKEEDLLSDTAEEVSTTASDPSSILSESQYTHVHKLFNMTVVLLSTGIADLVDVTRFLKDVNNWQHLGLELGILYPTLTMIEMNKRGLIYECKTEMLAAWLQQQDNVAVTGVTSCAVLKAALEKIGENRLASEINNL